MLSFDTTVTKDSTAYEGVRFTVRVLSDLERAKRDLLIMEDIARIAELMPQRDACLVDDPPVEGKDPTQRVDPAKRAEFTRIKYELDGAVARVRAAKINYSFVGIEGVETGGKPATIAQILASGHDKLIEEIEAACAEAEGLSATARKNSPSPGTSPAPAEEAKAPTTV